MTCCHCADQIAMQGRWKKRRKWSEDENWMSGNHNASYTITSGNSLLKRDQEGEVRIGDGIKRGERSVQSWKGISNNMKAMEL